MLLYDPIEFFENRNHQVLRNGRLTFVAPPFTKLDINPHQVYLCKCMGYCNALESSAPNTNLYSTAARPKNNLRPVMSGVGAYVWPIIWAWPCGQSHHKQLMPSCNNCHLLCFVNPNPIKNGNILWSNTWLSKHALFVVLIKMFIFRCKLFWPVWLCLNTFASVSVCRRSHCL